MAPLETDELGLIGMAMAALAFVVKSLAKLIEKPPATDVAVKNNLLITDAREAQREIITSMDAIVAEVQVIRDIIDRHTDRDERNYTHIQQVIAALDTKTEELLRMHRDPNAGFSTDETNRLLNQVLLTLGELRGELRSKE